MMRSFMRSKIIFAVNFVLLGSIAVTDICYMFLGGTPLKAAASFTFVAVGIVNAVFAASKAVGGKYHLVMPVALAVAMAGDIAINYDFIAGAAVFALGHVAYVVAYFLYNGFRPVDAVYAVAVFIPSALVITLVPVFDYGGAVLEAVCVVYALILSVMAGKALSDGIKYRTPVGTAVAVGSVLFFVSDLALLINQFGMISSSGHLAMRILCLSTYYAAQFLLAFSVYLYAVRKKQHDVPDRSDDADAYSAV